MYQSNAMEARLRPARRDVKDRPERRLRVVRAHGGFAFIEEGPEPINHDAATIKNTDPKEVEQDRSNDTIP